MGHRSRLTVPYCHQTVVSGWCFILISRFHFELLQAAERRSLVWWRPNRIRKQDLSYGLILTLVGKHNVFGTSVSFSVNQEFVLGYYVSKQDLM